MGILENSQLYKKSSQSFFLQIEILRFVQIGFFNISEVQKKSHYNWLLMWVWILSECKVLVFKRVFEIFLKYCLINLGWDWGCVIKIRWEGISGWRKLDFHKTTKIRLLNQWMFFYLDKSFLVDFHNLILFSNNLIIFWSLDPRSFDFCALQQIQMFKFSK